MIEIITQNRSGAKVPVFLYFSFIFILMRLSPF